METVNKDSSDTEHLMVGGCVTALKESRYALCNILTTTAQFTHMPKSGLENLEKCLLADFLSPKSPRQG